MEFEIKKKSKKSKARIGIIKTAHGDIETPSFVSVGTRANIKTLDGNEIKEAKTQILIANTYHLHLTCGEDVVKNNGGVAKFMNWNGPTMTDSGGFQVFSLGFGRDFGTGKILKQKSDQKILDGNQPKNIKITEKGVFFRSIINGDKIFLGPKESIKIQQKIGADIIFAFDECTSPIADYEYNKKAMERTHRWAKTCLDYFSKSNKGKQALFGIVQGGKYKDLRGKSAEFMASLPFDGFGIGGEFGDNKKIMEEMLDVVIEKLPENKPRHLLGIGHPEDIIKIIKNGVDTFDCIAPTHYARHGYGFINKSTPNGKTGKYIKIDLSRKEFLKDKKPLDKNCNCYVCKEYSRSYISHLIRSREITGLKLLSFHNIYLFNTLVENIREGIKKGRI